MLHKGSRVLVVDDDAHVRLFLQAVLTEIGYAVTEAENGMDALEKLTRGEFDLLIVDLMMPGMDGEELLQRVQEEYPEVKTMVLTGDNDLGGVQEAGSFGAQSYIRKPIVDLEAFLREIEQILDAPREHRKE